METPLAEAGDPHAIRVLGFVGNDGRCDLLAASRPAASRRSKALAIAEQNGATPQTLRRLDALLTEEEPGPSGEELEACKQAVDVLAKVEPADVHWYGKPSWEIALGWANAIRLATNGWN